MNPTCPWSFYRVVKGNEAVDSTRPEPSGSSTALGLTRPPRPVVELGAEHDEERDGDVSSIRFHRAG